jgi:hypothetical protein
VHDIKPLKMKEELDILKEEVKLLKRRSRFLQVSILMMFITGIVMSFTHEKDHTFKRIIAHEIIVVDDSGNERIILSSTISQSKSRIRTDTIGGILILDERGTDRIALGSTPTLQADGRIVKRVDSSIPIGFTFNDSIGNERGGFGFYDSRGLVSFGMDNKSGEGLTMFVADDHLWGQKVGLSMNYGNNGQVVYLGASQDKKTMLNLDVPNKGRLSVLIDSTGNSSITNFNYSNNSTQVLSKSN